MITAYVPRDGRLAAVPCASLEDVPAEAVWLDVCAPDEATRAGLARWIGAPLPDRTDVVAIETSERLYQAHDALVMTLVMPMVARVPDPGTSSMTLAATARRLVSIREAEPISIGMASKRVQSEAAGVETSNGALFILLDAIADRAADVIEECSGTFDAIASEVFEGKIDSRKSAIYQATIQKIGRVGVKVARMHDSCASLERLFLFLSLNSGTLRLSSAQKAQCKALGRDIRSIREHASALDAKLNFLLDATVGLVNLEQNQIIKIFSVLAVVFLPPTLIASIYGMNFQGMPELDWSYGYAFSLGVMVLSVLLTFLYFRWKKLL